MRALILLSHPNTIPGILEGSHHMIEVIDDVPPSINIIKKKEKTRQMLKKDKTSSSFGSIWNIDRLNSVSIYK